MKGKIMWGTMYGMPNDQNKAHKKDLLWFKSGKGEYVHASGLYLIKKDVTKSNSRWYIIDATTGEKMDHPEYECFSFSGFSLTDAKFEFEKYMGNTVTQ